MRFQNIPTGTTNWSQNLEIGHNYRSNSPFKNPTANIQSSYDNQSSLFNKRDNQREVMNHNHSGVFGAPPGFSGTDKISLLRRNPDVQDNASGNESPSGFPGGAKPFNQLFKK